MLDATEKFIDHEVRLRMNEAKHLELKEEIKQVKSLLRWILGIAITSIIVPIFLHHYQLV